jgi:putative membrane protein
LVLALRFWCSALPGDTWSWRWQPYLGVWAFVALVGGAYAWAVVRLQPRRLAGDDRPTHEREMLLFALGLLVLWIGADWPVGALAAGYLLSVKILQYLLFAYVAPALMLLGTPRWLLRRMIRGRVAFRLARKLSRALIPLAIFNGTLIVTRLPVVVDTLGASQLWSFVLDLAVIASGFVLWWPALARLPELNPMSYGMRIGYLGLNLFLPTVPASFFTFSNYPIYSIYELAPRVHGIAAVLDQRVAGLTMKILGGTILLSTMSVMFFRWYRQEDQQDATPQPAGSDHGRGS